MYVCVFYSIETKRFLLKWLSFWLFSGNKDTITNVSKGAEWHILKFWKLCV